MSICSAGDAFLSSKNYANLIIDESVCQTGWYSRLPLDLASRFGMHPWSISLSNQCNGTGTLTGWQWKSDGIRTLQKWSFFFFSRVFISWFFHYAKQSHNKTLIEIYFFDNFLVGIPLWQNSDLIPRLLEIFENLKNFSVILLSIKNDAYRWILGA